MNIERFNKVRHRILAGGLAAISIFAFWPAPPQDAFADPVQPPYNCYAFTGGWPERTNGYASCASGVGTVRVIVYCENGIRTTTVYGPWVRSGGTIATRQYSYGYCSSTYPYAYAANYQTREG